ncbi:MAG: hypothetical protein AAF449_00930, partial [Myxococcota bacterium]
PGPDISVDPTRSADACNTQFGYANDDIVPGFDLIIGPAEDQNPLTPGVDLKFNTQYVVMVRSDTQGGLRDADGDPIEPSGLFFTLNVDDAPVAADGTILSALLRSQVQNGVLDAAFGGRLLEDLNEQERAALDAQVQMTGQSIVPLYAVFNGVIQLATGNGLVNDRSDFVFVNTWNTGGPPQAGPVFDPLTGAVPFPNSELLLSVATGRVTIPDIPGSPIPSAALPGVNKLDGFSLRVPAIGPLPETGPIIQFSMQAPVDLATVADSIAMFPLDDTGAPMDAIMVNVRPTSTSAPSTLIVQPLLPLQPDTTYVIGVTRDLKQAGGADFGSSTTFELLKTPAPLITDGTVSSSVAPALQCAPLTRGGSALAGPQEVAGTATALEPLRARWQPTFAALEAAGIPRTNLLLGWSYTTQSITNDLDQLKMSLEAGDFDPDRDRVLPTGVRAEGPANIAALIDVVGNLCLPLCQQGELPTVDPATCVDGNGNPAAAIASDPICTLATNILTSNLGSVELFLAQTHRVTGSNPFVDGTFTAERFTAPLPIDVPVWLVTPSTPPGEDGYPVVIFQHGLGRSKDDGFQMVNTLAAAGWATVMLDLPIHGDRASDLTTNTQTPIGFVEIPCETPINPDDVMCDPQTGMCTGGCDGVQDSSGTGFLSANTSANRDNLRQATLDHLALSRAIQQASADGGAWSQLNPDRVAYVGQSLGGITGANSLAFFDDSVRTAVLNVAGGDLIQILLTSIVAVPLRAQLNALGFCDYIQAGNPASGCQLTPDFVNFVALADWTQQASDPIYTAPAVGENFGFENILMQVAIPDPVVPNPLSEALATRYGFQLDDDTGPYQQYDFSSLDQSMVGGGCHGFLLSPTCGQCLTDSLCVTLGAQIQAATFLQSEGQVISSRVPPALGEGLSCVNPCGGPASVE